MFEEALFLFDVIALLRRKDGVVSLKMTNKIFMEPSKLLSNSFLNPMTLLE